CLTIYGWRKQEALPILALQASEQSQLIFSFNPFSDDINSQIVSQGNDGTHNLGVFFVKAQAVYKRAINLKAIYRESVEIAQGRIASPKVINAQLDIQSPELKQ